MNKVVHAACIALVAAVTPALAGADNRPTAVPAQRQLLVLLRVLSYDYTIKKRTGGDLRVAVLYRPESVESKQAGRAVMQAFGRLDKVTVRGMPVSAVLLPYVSSAQFKSDTERLQVDTVYVCPGLENALDSILSVTRSARMSTLSGVEDHLRRGVAVGVVRQGKEVQVLVNLKSAEAHGQQFAAGLLELARLVRSP